MPIKACGYISMLAIFPVFFFFVFVVVVFNGNNFPFPVYFLGVKRKNFLLKKEMADIEDIEDI